jgi:uncharacterized protein (DUF2164 family)
MRISLSDERRRTILETLIRFHREEFDEELSSFRAEQILGFFVGALGPPLYNQAIQDARGFILEKLDDLDGEFYETEGPGE